MLVLSTEILSRLQFAFTISFHAIFPTLNIGLAVFLVYWEYQYLKTDSKFYLKLCQFWMKIFALSFGMGVVSGVVLAYELGANFSGLIAYAGNILGPLMLLETMTAFFLEAGFLGIMLFGWNRVGKRAHFLSTCMVSMGTVISLLWIMSANSFMQTPVGYKVFNNTLIIADSWIPVIFNPSFILRALHMLIATLLTTSFFVMGVSGYFFFKNKDVLFAKASFTPALYVALLLSILQVFSGDRVGLMVYKYQPIKTAAIEANWQTKNSAPLILFAIPDIKNRVNHFEISIPKLGSWINTRDLNGVLPGLESVKQEDLPPVAAVFYSFRVMVGIGLWFIFLASWGMYCKRRHQLVRQKLFLYAIMLSTPLGFVATIAGWMTSEMGRQPWVIYKIMRTKDSISNLPAEQVLTSLTIIFILYLFFFYSYLRFVRKVICEGFDKKSKVLLSSIGDSDD